ncbi:hypothetical protein MOU90_002639 [Vibrio parahaemolyticus]|nr:hypothetical protein [Vibrio parahaemolyticus]
MKNDAGMLAHSAKSFLEQYDKLGAQIERQEKVANLKTKQAIEQIELLKEANVISKLAYDEALNSKVQSEKSSKIAMWANAIAFASFVVATASLVFAVVMANNSF